LPTANHHLRQPDKQARGRSNNVVQGAGRPEASRRGGLFNRLFGRGTSTDTKNALDLADIQGFILRGYRMPMVRHFLLTVGVPAEARRLLGRFVSGNEVEAPQITTAEDWHVGFEPGPGDNPDDAPRRKPDYCLNISITWPGMLALEIRDRLPTLSFKSFDAFVKGAAERAKLVGDIGESDPQHWIGGFGAGGDHVLVTLHALNPEAMEVYSDRLSALFAEGGAFREIWRADGMALMEVRDGEAVPTFKVHFGYTDGISQTTIRSGPERYPLDHQQPCEPWLFVLRDDAENYLMPEPRELGFERQLCRFQDDQDRRGRVRELSSVEQGHDRSRTARRQDLWPMAQWRSAGIVAGQRQPRGWSSFRAAQ
jgi:hypothetical protein